MSDIGSSAIDLACHEVSGSIFSGAGLAWIVFAAGSKVTLGFSCVTFGPVSLHIDFSAPKTGAEKPSNFEPAADTIHASPPPTQVVEINELDVCRRVINQHGISRQLAKAAEEFSEAAAAISRFLAGEGEYAEIVGEVADVEVMCVQMRLIYGADAIDQVRAEKVARLHGRLKTEF